MTLEGILFSLSLCFWFLEQKESAAQHCQASIGTQRWDTLWATRGSPANCWQESSKAGRNLCSTNFTLACWKPRVRPVTDSLRGFLQCWSRSSHPKLSGADWKRLWDSAAETVSTQVYLCREQITAQTAPVLKWLEPKLTAVLLQAGPNLGPNLSW